MRAAKRVATRGVSPDQGAAAPRKETAASDENVSPVTAMKIQVTAWVEKNKLAHRELGSLGPAFQRVVESLERCVALF